MRGGSRFPLRRVGGGKGDTRRTQRGQGDKDYRHDQQNPEHFQAVQAGQVKGRDQATGPLVKRDTHCQSRQPCRNGVPACPGQQKRKAPARNDAEGALCPEQGQGSKRKNQRQQTDRDGGTDYAPPALPCPTRDGGGNGGGSKPDDEAKQGVLIAQRWRITANEIAAPPPRKRPEQGKGGGEKQNAQFGGTHHPQTRRPNPQHHDNKRGPVALHDLPADQKAADYQKRGHQNGRMACLFKPKQARRDRPYKQTGNRKSEQAHLVDPLVRQHKRGKGSQPQRNSGNKRRRAIIGGRGGAYSSGKPHKQRGNRNQQDRRGSPGTVRNGLGCPPVAQHPQKRGSGEGDGNPDSSDTFTRLCGQIAQGTGNHPAHRAPHQGI